jgi:hypothetical protein
VRKISIASDGIGASDRLLLSAFIELIALPDGARFVLDEAPSAQIIFISAAALQTHRERATPEWGRHFVLYGDTDASAPEYVLATPVRLAPLKELLSALVAKIQSANSPVAPSQPDSAHVAPAHRRLEQFVRLLRRCDASVEMLSFEGLDGLRICYLTASKQFAVLGGNGSWEHTLAAQTGAISLVSVQAGAGCFAEAKQSAAPWSNATVLSRDQFVWLAVHQLSQGVLLPGIASRNVYLLNAWPDFGVLGADPLAIKAAALLTRRACSVSQTVQASGLSREKVIGLINACALLDLLRHAPNDLLSAGADASFVPLLRDSSAVTLARDPSVEPLQASIQRASPNPNLRLEGSNKTAISASATQSISLSFLSKLRSALGFGTRKI